LNFPRQLQTDRRTDIEQAKYRVSPGINSTISTRRLDDLETRRAKRFRTFVCKTFTTGHPIIGKLGCRLVRDTYGTGLRSSNNYSAFKPDLARTSAGEATICYRASMVWNDIPAEERRQLLDHQ
jgi:hypothetical protein